MIQYSFEMASNLLRKISEETSGKNLTIEQRIVFNESFYKGMLEELIVGWPDVAKHFENRLDTVRKLNKLGKLWTSFTSRPWLNFLAKKKLPNTFFDSIANLFGNNHEKESA